LNPLPQGLFIPRNSNSIFIRASVTQVSDVAHGPLVILLYTRTEKPETEPKIFRTDPIQKNYGTVTALMLVSF
jgi:hypothetical protein